MSNVTSVLAGVFVTLSLVACVSTETPVPERVERALADPSDADIPVIFDDGMALVPVFIGEYGPTMFVLDTGASMSAITPTTRDRLGFTTEDGGTAHITGASGQEPFQALRLDSVQVGLHSVHDLRVAVVDLAVYQHSDIAYGGILGHDFLEHFDFTYDLRNEKLHLYPHGDDSERAIVGLDSLKRVSFNQRELGSGFIVMDLTVGDQPAEGIFDTGSRHTVLNWNAAHQDGVGAFGDSAQETLGIGHEGATATHLYTFDTIRADEVIFNPIEVSVADLPIFRSLDLNDGAAVLFGNDMLKDRLIVVSYSTRTVYFSEPQGDEEEQDQAFHP